MVGYCDRMPKKLEYIFYRPNTGAKIRINSINTHVCGALSLRTAFSCNAGTWPLATMLFGSCKIVNEKQHCDSMAEYYRM